MISSVRGVLANLLNFRLSLSFGRKKRRGSGSNDRENETFFVHLISFSSHQLVAREQATLHARVQATRSRLRCVVIAHVPFFNDFCEFPKIATHAVTRSRARIAVIRITIVWVTSTVCLLITVAVLCRILSINMVLRFEECDLDGFKISRVGV